jgi:hypothetical protein
MVTEQQIAAIIAANYENCLESLEPTGLDSDYMFIRKFFSARCILIPGIILKNGLKIKV